MTNLTEAQRKMLLASEPDDVTGKEGCGVELRTGAEYAVARALQKRGLGNINGPGGFVCGMYWSNAEGIAERSSLISSRERL